MKSRMTSKRAVLVALATVSTLGLTTACGSSGGGGTGGSAHFTATPSGSLNAWAFDNPDDVGLARLADAKATLKNVNIHLDETPFDAQKFTTRVAGGTVPDVVQMDRQFVATYAAQGLIMPLDKCYAAHNVVPKQRFYQAMVDDVTYKNHIWAVPQFLQPNFIIVNERVTQAAGVSDAQIDTSKPSDLLAAIKKMYKTSGGNPSVLGFDPVPTGQEYQWVTGLGGQLIDSSGKPTLDNSNNVYPLQFLKQLTDAQGGWAKVKSFSDRFDTFGKNNQYVKDQVGAQVNAQWYPNVLAPYKDRIKIKAVPFNDKNGQPVSVTGGSAFVVPAKAKNPDAACAWMIRLTDEQNWIAAEKARVQTLKKNGGINTGLFTGSPKTDQDIKSQYVKPSGDAGFDQVTDMSYQVVKNSKGYGASPVGQQIKDALTNAITSTLLGSTSAKDALKAAQQVAMNAWNQTKH